MLLCSHRNADLSGGDSLRWSEHSNPICCSQKIDLFALTVAHLCHAYSCPLTPKSISTTFIPKSDHLDFVDMSGCEPNGCE